MITSRFFAILFVRRRRAAKVYLLIHRFVLVSNLPTVINSYSSLYHSAGLPLCLTQLRRFRRNGGSSHYLDFSDLSAKVPLCPVVIAECVMQDVYGPLEILNLVATEKSDIGISVSVVGETKEPVPSCANSIVGEATSYLQPTYTIDENPELDVLRTTSFHPAVPPRTLRLVQ